MSWWSTTPVVLAAIAALFAPGLIVGLSARLRGLHLFAFAAPISVSVVAVSAVGAPLVGLRWSPLPVLIGTAVTALVCAILAYRVRSRRPVDVRAEKFSWREALVSVAAVGAAAGLIGRRLLYVLGSPDALSQTFDNIFHLNVVRYILDTGNASSTFVTTLTGDGFYPAAWHDVVALVAGGGFEITVATNAVNLVIASLVWPLSVIALTRALVGARLGGLVLGAVLSTGFGAFPILLLDFGVLFPNFLGYALLPATMALLARAAAVSSDERLDQRMSLILLALSLPGLALAHPNSLMTLLAVSVPLTFLVWMRWWRRCPQTVGGRIGPVGVLLAGAAGVAVAWRFVRPPSSAATWMPVETVGQAVGEVISLSGIGRQPASLPALLALFGLGWVAFTHGRRWYLGIYAVVAILFVTVAGVPFGTFRTAVTGVYYNDPPRLAALLPMIGIPVACAGGLWLWDRSVRLVVGRLRLRQTTVNRRVLPILALTLVCLSAVAVQNGQIVDAASAASNSYRLTPNSRLISTDEMALLNRLAVDIPSDAVIVGNPWNGSPLAYAIADRRVIQAHILSAVPPELPVIYDRLNSAKTEPDVCHAVHDLRITYVLDFGHQEVHGGDHGARGLDNLVEAGVGQLVDQQGAAKLIRITACGS